VNMNIIVEMILRLEETHEKQTPARFKIFYLSVFFPKSLKLKCSLFMTVPETAI
jgi:hypothetical protein